MKKTFITSIKILFSLLLATQLSACGDDYSGKKKRSDDAQYPLDPEVTRRVNRGWLGNKDSLSLFGGTNFDGTEGQQGSILLGNNKNGEADSGTLSSGISAELWKASLDTISFMPLASVDAVGGVIITDWYQAPESQNERVKVNVVVSGNQLQTDGVRVSVFRQEASGSGWKDVAANPELSRKLEDKILMRAREIHIGKDRVI